MTRIDSLAELVNMTPRRQRRLPPPRYDRLRVENHLLEEQMKEEEATQVEAFAIAITTTVDEQNEVLELSKEISNVTLTDNSTKNLAGKSELILMF